MPRLWLKASLAAAGRLPHGYKDIRPGFDFMVLEGIGIDPEAVRAFIDTSRPTYPEFEAWIKAQTSADLSQENIERVNQIVTERTKGDESRRKMLAKVGLPDNSPISNSIMLNNLDDWNAVHQQLFPKTRQ